MNFIIAQIFGIAVTIYAAIGTQFRSMKAILVMEIITNLMTASTYILLGSLSGMWVCVVAAVQAILLSRLNMQHGNSQEKKRKFIVMVFALVYVIGSIVVYERPVDVFPCICALIFSFSVCQKDALYYKMIATFNPLFWIFYDYATGAYTTILTRVMLIVLTGIGIVRLMRQRKMRKEKTKNAIV